MKKLHLHLGENIQGEFNPKPLNLLLAFQVNCPGCIASALPMVQELYEKYGQDVGILGLSTAFQYYDLNNTANTIILVEEGGLVDHSKDFMKSHGYDKLPYKMTFPIVMDPRMKPEQTEMVADIIVETSPDVDRLTVDQKVMANKRVSAYLGQQEEVSITFTANQFKGTPTFVLFTDEMEIVANWFGHTTRETIMEEIDSILKES